jgi:hypothetical protein
MSERRSDSGVPLGRWCPWRARSNLGMTHKTRGLRKRTQQHMIPTRAYFDGRPHEGEARLVGEVGRPSCRRDGGGRVDLAFLLDRLLEVTILTTSTMVTKPPTINVATRMTFCGNSIRSEVRRGGAEGWRDW